MPRRLEVEVIGSTKDLERALGSAGKSGNKFGKAIKAGALVAGAGLAGLAVAAKVGFGEFMESEQVMAQTKAGLKSTGGAAKVTARDITELASRISRMSGIDDEAVQAGENMLLTFTRIRNEVGKGNQIFDRATLAVADFATKMNNGAIPSSEQMSKASILVGKALNDPIKGVTSLTRAGVQFTVKQKEKIKALVASGKAMAAQKIVLRELATQFGGAAKAAGETLGGQLSKLRNRFDEFAGGIVGKAIPALEDFFKKLGDAKGFEAKLDVVWTGIQQAGAALTAAIGRAVAAVDWVSAWGKAQGIAAGLEARFKTLDWSAIGAAVGTGIAQGVSKSAVVAKQLADAILGAARTVDWVKIGKAIGPGLAAAVATAFVTLGDPAFWVKNWDLAFAVALTVSGGSIARFAGRLALKALGPLTKAGGDMVLAVAGGIEKFAPRLASALLTGLSKLPAVVAAGLGRLTSPVTSAFNRLSGLAQFTVKVLGIQAAIGAIAGLVSQAGVKLGQFAHFVNSLPGQFSNAGYAIGKAIVDGIKNGIAAGAAAIKTAAVNAVKGAVASAKSFLHIDSPSKLMAQQVGVPMAQGIAQGIAQSQAVVSNALRGVLMQAIRSQNFGAVSSIIQSMFSAKQAAVRTPAEKRIAAIERSRELADLKLAIKDATAATVATMAALAAAPQAIANAQAALTAAQAGGDPEAIAAAQAALDEAEAAKKALELQLAADKRAEARAKQDLVLFNLREKAEKERAKLDAKQLAQQIRLGMALERLQKLFDKQHVTSAALLAAVRRMLKKLGIPGFAGGVRNFSGGLARVGERGPEIVNLPRGSDVIPNSRVGGGTVHEHHYHGPVVQDSQFIAYLKNLERQDRARNGRAAFGTS